MELPRGISIVSDPNYKPAKIICPVVETYKQREVIKTLPKYDPTVTLDQLKEHWIDSAIKHTGGHIAKAAVLLGYSKETLYKRNGRIREKK
jgi:DNA-binding NtrC family response regulator